MGLKVGREIPCKQLKMLYIERKQKSLTVIPTEWHKQYIPDRVQPVFRLHSDPRHDFAKQP